MEKKIIGDNLKKGEAKKLAAWWNAFANVKKQYYFVRKMDKGKYYEVYQQ